MNLIENWGSGVKRYVAEIKAAGLREPEFIEWPNAMRVNIYRNKVTPQVAPQDGPESTAPQDAPTVAPSVTPTVAPSVTPTVAPSVTPIVAPSVTPTVAPSVAPSVSEFSSPRFSLLLKFLETEANVSTLLSKLGSSNRIDLVRRYLRPLLSAGLIERTIPDKPTSRFQKYRLTDKGRATLANLMH